jgi:hypothetical protein
MSSTNMITNNGWEFLTEISPMKLPNEQKLQDSYLQNYNLAYHKFLKSLCIDSNNLENIINDIKKNPDNKTGEYITKYKFVIDVTDENDIINNDDTFPIKFLKSKFITFKQKKLKTDLINYYKPLGYFIKGPNELVHNKNIKKYYIELCWNNNNNSEII